MTNDAEQTSYLAGDTDGRDLPIGDRQSLDRIRAGLAAETAWAQPAAGARARLLAAAAADVEAVPAPEVADPPVELHPPAEPLLATPAPAPEEPTAPIDLGERRRGRHRAGWFGGGVLAAAAAAAIAFIAVDQLTDAPASGPEVTAIHELAATPLDPDAVATLEVKPTVAGVEFELTLMGLDNTDGGDYYAAWLMGDGEAVPLGSFHWRKGGVPIILWSGVDDPTYDRVMITRQVQGDGGVRSDEVVLMGMVPELTASTVTED